MAQLLSEKRDIDFVLHEQMEISDITKHKKFKEFNKKTIDLVLNEARNIAIKEIYPTNQISSSSSSSTTTPTTSINPSNPNSPN